MRNHIFCYILHAACVRFDIWEITAIIFLFPKTKLTSAIHAPIVVPLNNICIVVLLNNSITNLSNESIYRFTALLRFATICMFTYIRWLCGQPITRKGRLKQSSIVQYRWSRKRGYEPYKNSYTNSYPLFYVSTPPNSAPVNYISAFITMCLTLGSLTITGILCLTIAWVSTAWTYQFLSYTVSFCYKVVQYNVILNTSLSWLGKTISQSCNAQRTPHISR